MIQLVLFLLSDLEVLEFQWVLILAILAHLLDL